MLFKKKLCYSIQFSLIDAQVVLSSFILFRYRFIHDFCQVYVVGVLRLFCWILYPNSDFCSGFSTSKLDFWIVTKQCWLWSIHPRYFRLNIFRRDRILLLRFDVSTVHRIPPNCEQLVSIPVKSFPFSAWLVLLEISWLVWLRQVERLGGAA